MCSIIAPATLVVNLMPSALWDMPGLRLATGWALPQVPSLASASAHPRPQPSHLILGSPDPHREQPPTSQLSRISQVGLLGGLSQTQILLNMNN